MLDTVTQAKFEATLPQIQPVTASNYRKTLYTKETAETEDMSRFVTQGAVSSPGEAHTMVDGVPNASTTSSREMLITPTKWKLLLVNQQKP